MVRASAPPRLVCALLLLHAFPVLTIAHRATPIVAEPATPLAATPVLQSDTDILARETQLAELFVPMPYRIACLTH